MGFSIISATVPCLRIFLQAASPQFLLGENYVDPLQSALATAGSGGGTGYTGKGSSRNRSGGDARGASFKMSNLSARSRRDDEGLKFTTNKYGETVTQAGRAAGTDKISIASDSSERAIVVRQTVAVQYGQE